MLGELLKLIENKRLTSISKTAELLMVTPEMVRTMLDDLQRMGFIRKIVTGCNSCGECRKCSPVCGVVNCNESKQIEVWELINKID